MPADRRRSRAPKLVVVLCLAFAAIAPSSAAANLVSPASLTLPIRVPSMGGFSVGLANLNVTYTDTEATATVVAPTVMLGKGNVFEVDTCLKAHSLNVSFETTCDRKTVDTTSNLATVTIAAPTVSAQMARPVSGKSAYFSYIVSISAKQAGGNFKGVASSWPAGGLTASSIGVPPQAALTAPTPSSEGVRLSSGATGGVNSMNPDSFCVHVDHPDVPPAEDGVSTSGLGSDAPAYYEIGEPSGAYAGQPPKGVILVIHGGGWSSVGPGQLDETRGDADRWRARGWRTLNIDYRPCNHSFDDVKWFYDRAQALWGSSMPYCALGASAGGTLAMMLAIARPSVACVENQAGPADAAPLTTQTTPKGGSQGPRALYNVLTSAVGSENLVWWSPALFHIPARVLCGVAADDPYVPYAQCTELKSKMLARDPAAYVDTMQLASGSSPWTHANVSATALQSFYSAEDQLVAGLVAGGPAA